MLMTWNYRRTKIARVFTARHFLHLIRYKKKLFEKTIGEKEGSYTTYLKKKKAGGYREIFVPNQQLKRLQQAVHKNILQEINFALFVHCGPRGRGVSSAIKGHERYKCHQSLDIEGFFDNVTPNSLRVALKRVGFNAKIISLIVTVASTRNKLPQGFPTSALLSALVMNVALEDFYKIFGPRGVLLSAYSDDLLLSSDDMSAIVDAKKYIEEKLARFALKLNSKGSPAKNGKDFSWLGLRVYPRAVVPKKVLRELERALYRYKVYGEVPAALPPQSKENTRKIWESKLRGKVVYAESVSKNQLVGKARKHLEK